MPIERELRKTNNLDIAETKLLDNGTFHKIDMAHSQVFVFCDTKGKGKIKFGGNSEDLTYLSGDGLKIVEPNQVFEIHENSQLLITDDENILHLRHTNVIAVCFKNLTANQT